MYAYVYMHICMYTYSCIYINMNTALEKIEI